MDGEPPMKKGRIDPVSNQGPTPPQVQHAVLSHYYSHVFTLRNYVLSRLPVTSRLRRKKVAAIGVINKSPDAPLSDMGQALGSILDSTLIGVPDGLQSPADNRLEGWKAFSQKADESYVTLSDGVAGFVETQTLVRPKLPKTCLFNPQSYFIYR